MSNPLYALAEVAARRLPMPVKRFIYQVKPLARLIRSGLNRVAPAGLAQVRVAAGALAGLTLSLDLQTEKDYWLGTYEPELQAAISELVRPGSVAYDVGANIGYLSLLLAKAVGEGGCVVAFEALPGNVERLQRNLALNGIGSRVRVVSGAVVDVWGPVRFLVGPSAGMGKVVGSAGRKKVAYAETITVPGIVLDDYIYREGNPVPQVIKMDIEGGEVLALPGMRRVLAEARPLVLMELHGPEAAEAAWGQLLAAGYTICRMERRYPPISSLAELDWKAYIVALPSDWRNPGAE